MPHKLIDFKSKHPLTIRSKAKDTAEIVLYASIGQDFWGDSISAKQFSDELKKLDSSVKNIDLRLNSPGGDVFDGMAIYNRLKQHSAKVTVHIDGWAASIASIIALAGDEIVMGEGSLYMVHLPWTFTMGDRNDLDNTINRLMDIEEQMISIYAKRTKLDRTEIKKMLEDETWMDATQAIEHGFVDSTSDKSVPIAASALANAKWITKPPKNFVSETKVITERLENLKQRVSATLARK